MALAGILGGIGGLAAGGLGAYGNTMAARKQRREQEAALRDYQARMGGLQGQYQDASDRAIRGYQAGAQQYMNDPSKINQWMNPYADAMQENLARQNAAQYGAGGKMLSGARMLALQDAQMGQYGQMYNDAFNMMNQSNNQGLGVQQNLAGMKTGQAENIYNVGAGQLGNEMQMRSQMTQEPNWAQNLSGMLGTAGQGVQLGLGISNAFGGPSSGSGYRQNSALLNMQRGAPRVAGQTGSYWDNVGTY